MKQTIPIDVAIRDMTQNGEDMYGGIEVEEPTTGEEVSYARTPRRGGPPDTVPYAGGTPVQAQPVVSNERLIVIESDSEGQISLTFRDSQSVLELIEQVGVQNVINYIPNSDPSLWKGKMIIIRGQLVIPKAVTTYRLEGI